MAEDEIIALKKAFANQCIMMQDLYTELEEEREASASGAEEALSMILRLQKEKAEEKMEACQYKRMAEAKLHHAEESLEILKEVVFQKEIEIASLKYQVQAYKCMLLSIDVNVPDYEEMKLFDNRRFSKSAASLGKASFHAKVKRQISLPSIHFDKLCSETNSIDKDGYILPAIQSICKGIGDYQNQLKESQRKHLSEEFVIEECNSSDSEHTQEAKTTKELSLAEYIDESFRFKSILEDMSENMLSSLCLEVESKGSKTHSIKNLDISEESRNLPGQISSGPSNQLLQEPPLRAKQMMPQKAMDHLAGNEHFSKNAFMNSLNDAKQSRTERGNNRNYCLSHVEPEVGTVPYVTDVEELKTQIQQLADDIKMMKKEDSKRGNEQSMLLSEIQEDLKAIQSSINYPKTTKHSEQEEFLFVSLTEALLSFYI